MKNENFKCGIYIKDIHKKQVFSNIFNQIFKLLPLQTNGYRVLNNELSIFFQNGSYIQVCVASDYARGKRNHSLIIDNEIKNEIVNTIIRPKLIPYYKQETDNYETTFVDIDYRKEELDRYKEKLIMPTRGNRASVFFDDYFYTKEEDVKTLPIIEKDIEEENKRVYVFNAFGIQEDAICYEEKFVNKTKKLYLKVFGESHIDNIEYENRLNAEIYINDEIYNGYKVIKSNGLVFVELYEKENSRPEMINYK